MRRPWTREEIARALRLWRLGWSYKEIGEDLGRNHSSVGWIIRREDLAEEARLVAEEDLTMRELGFERTVFITGFFAPFYLNEQPGMRPQGPTKVKQITDGRDFLASVLGQVRVMLDPYTIDGKKRWTEVRLEE